MRFLVTLLTVAILLTSFGRAGAESVQTAAGKVSPHTLAVIPFYSPEKIWKLYAPFISYLQKSTGQPWELKLYHDHDSLLEGLCKGEVAIALLGPIPLGRVNQMCGIKPFLVALGKDGKPFYRSIVVTNDMAVADLGMLRGKKFALFKGSTAAHILPLKMLNDAGIGDAIQPVFFEGQDRIMTALLTREVAAAGIKEALFRKFEKEPLKQLKTSPPLPNFAFCASPAVKSTILQQFTEQLLKLHPLLNPDDAAMVKDWDDEIKFGFVPPDADFLSSVVRLNRSYQEIMHEAQ